MPVFEKEVATRSQLPGFDADQSIASRFELQVSLYPNNLAIADSSSSKTYDELNRMANRIARELVAFRPHTQATQVAVYLEKGIQYVAAVFGVLKAGHAYVPIDPTFPQSRNDYIISDSQASILLTNTLNLQAARELASQATQIINLDEISENTQDSNLGLDIAADSMAYIVYTSGSTGKPKGVVQNNRNAVHGSLQRGYLQEISANDRMTLFYSCSVMGSVYCIFTALLNGASLFSYDIRDQGLDELSSWLQEKQITMYHSVASVFRGFASTYKGGDTFAVRLVIFGGERVLASDVALARSVFSNNITFYTGLGSTETGTIRYFRIDPETVIDSKVVPIGYAIDDKEVVLVDEEGNPVPTGEMGEITVRSPYIALGYWNNPEATDKVFGQLPNDPQMRIYRMGDMAELNTEGLLQHRGRKDFQVKIRGFRVEIGEIETALLDHPSIAEVVVMAKEINEETQLVAYVVTDESIGKLGAATLREYLNTRLPYYMVPTVYVGLNEIAKTPNNKVDRLALPQPSPDNELSDDVSVPPNNDFEQGVVDICEQLLRKTGLGINHNFFDLGGHSLLATQLVSRVADRFGVRLSMRAVFDANDIQALAIDVEEAAEDDSNTVQAHFPKAPRDKRLPLSFAQRRMWLVNEILGESSAYNISNTVRLEGALDIHALERSICEIVQRHEVLRTVIQSDDKGPWQEVKPYVPVVLSKTDLRDTDASEKEDLARQLTHNLVSKPYILKEGPLFSCALIRLDDTVCDLVLVFHHIIYDNIWSSGLFFNELGALYQAYSLDAQAPSPLPPLNFQFGDFAFWEQERVKQTDRAKLFDYWKKQLNNLPDPLQVPADRLRPDKPSFRGGQIAFQIPASVRVALGGLARNESLTSFMLLLAAWQLFLHRYTQQEDILVGTPTGRRYRTETEPLIGLFINNLAMRADFSGKPSFRELLRNVRQTTIDAFSHDEVPFEDLVAELNPQRSAAITPFFQHFFIHRNATETKWQIPGLELTPLRHHSGNIKFDLTLSMLEDERQLTGTLEYSGDLYDHESAQRMVANYIKLLTSVIEAPDCPVWELELLAEPERKKLLEQCNPPATAYPSNYCTHQLFEKQVSERPEAIAVVSEAGNLSYTQLNQRANQLAHRLQALGVGPDDLVAVCVERSADLIVALLGVLKSGGAYVPLDPHFPMDRLTYMVEDSGASVFISQQGVIEKFSDLEAEIILLDAETFSGMDESVVPKVIATPDNLAYVIYTSGSTGKPKGVQLTQQALVNFLCSMGKEPGISADDVFHSLTTICFDIAALEIFLPLISGASVVMKSREVSLDPSLLLESLKDSGSTMMQATPVTWGMLIDHGWKGDPDIKVLCGGEAMGLDLAQNLINSGCEVWNLYGPTETTIWSSVRRVKEKEDAQYVGYPIANTQFHIYSPQLTLQPIGVPGELLIGGDGLARGYYKREDLTLEKFIPHPLEPQQRLYRTGDLVVRRNNGNIEFLGRLDNQVKLRGFRIELGEIESRLVDIADVNQCVVIAREDTPGDKRLVAYVSAHNNAELDPANLLEHLRKDLPDYMVPSALVVLDSFPLTPNAKIDRKKLPAPSDESIAGTSQLVPPRNDFEQSVLAVWKRALNISSLGITDNFFHVGGHSLLAISVVKEMVEATGIEFDVGVLFRYPTIMSISESLGDDVETRSSNVVLLNECKLSEEEKLSPLFLLCGLDIYQELADNIEGRDVYGVFVVSELAMIRDVVEGKQTEVSFKLLCEHYLDAVTRFIPDGSYLLGGVSFGGFIALDVARKIRERGGEVDTVCLMDTAVPGSKKMNYRKFLTHHLLSFPPPLLQNVYQKFRRSMYDKPAVVGDSLTDLNEKRRVRDSAFIEAMRKERDNITSYSGDVVVFRAKDRNNGAHWWETNHSLGWDEKVNGKLDVVEVSGDHLGILQAENLQVISDHINSIV
ncbi:MAG: amino acid adenylation domain-containing protein [Spongiibacteraceae bacterium]|nr:amino acid adenylation domain-containing protein [Spongiibacteraceae bacterium]